MGVKLTFQMIVFNSDYVLEPVLESILAFGDVVVTEGPVQYYVDQGYTTSTDRTNEILADMVGEENVVHGQWAEKTEMMNAAVHLIPEDTTHVFMVDADEVWKGRDIGKIMECLRDGVNSMSFKMWSFFAGFDRYITGFEENFEVHRVKRWYPGARWAEHRPPTVLAPSGESPYPKLRHMDHNETDNLGIRFFHYSFVFPSQVLAKTPYYQAYTKGHNIPGYFDNVWMPWAAFPGKRFSIEQRYLGVHDWLPRRRGPSYTAPFKGEHPQPIRKRMEALTERFDFELDAEKAKRGWR